MQISHLAMPGKPSASRRGRWMFLRQWLSNPLRMGSVVPSSPALCRRIVRHAWPAPGKTVLELGAGTGVIGRALLDAGLPPERLVVVEIVPAMAALLRVTLPGVGVIEGDARELATLVSENQRRRIGSVICGIPMVLLPRHEQRRLIDVIAALAPDSGFLHYSYCLTSPLPAAAHGLTAQRVAWTLFNLPPASVWRYASLQTPRHSSC